MAAVEGLIPAAGLLDAEAGAQPAEGGDGVAATPLSSRGNRSVSTAELMKRLNKLAPFKGLSAQGLMPVKPSLHLSMYNVCMEGASEAQRAELFPFSLEMVGKGSDGVGLWYGSLPEAVTSSWSEMTARFLADWQVEVSGADERARDELHEGKYLMHKGEELRQYHLRFTRLMNACTDMAASDRIRWYLKGLPAGLRVHCATQPSGQTWTDLKSCMDWAHACEKRQLSVRSERNAMQGTQNRPSAAATSGSKQVARKRADEQRFKTPPPKRQRTTGPAGVQQERTYEAPRSQAWLAACRKFKLCHRCGEQGHFVKNNGCGMAADARQPSDLPGVAVTAGFVYSPPNQPSGSQRKQR